MQVEIGPYSPDRVENIRIDDYDVWNVDTTIATILAPLLIKFKEVHQGSPLVYNEDVPDYLRTSTNSYASSEEDNFHKKWDFVLDELIHTFTAISKYETGTSTCPRVHNGLRLFAKYYFNLWD